MRPFAVGWSLQQGPQSGQKTSRRETSNCEGDPPSRARNVSDSETFRPPTSRHTTSLALRPYDADTLTALALALALTPGVSLAHGR
jgi:hypothetical protein